MPDPRANETHALRAAVPETTARNADSGDAQRADDRGQPQGESPCAEVVAPYCAPPVATSATPDESNRHHHDEKRFATLQARAALAGYALQVDPLGAYYCTRWGYVTLFESLDEAEAWIQRVSGKKQPSAWNAYEAGKAEFLAANPQASADEIEEHAKRLARKEGL